MIIVHRRALAVLLGRSGERRPIGPYWNVLAAAVSPVRRTAFALSGMVERIDGVLRLWPAAGLSLRALALLFGAAMLGAS
jgi:hypothetical protein